MTLEPGKSYTTDNLAAEWWTTKGGGWLVFDLRTGNAIGDYKHADDLLRDLPEFHNARPVSEK